MPWRRLAWTIRLALELCVLLAGGAVLLAEAGGADLGARAGRRRTAAARRGEAEAGKGGLLRAGAGAATELSTSTYTNKAGVEVKCSGDPYCEAQPYIECCPQGPDAGTNYGMDGPDCNGRPC